MVFKYTGETEPVEAIPSGSIIRLALSPWLDNEKYGRSCRPRWSGWYRGSLLPGRPGRGPRRVLTLDHPDSCQAPRASCEHDRDGWAGAPADGPPDADAGQERCGLPTTRKALAGGVEPLMQSDDEPRGVTRGIGITLGKRDDWWEESNG